MERTTKSRIRYSGHALGYLAGAASGVILFDNSSTHTNPHIDDFSAGYTSLDNWLAQYLVNDQQMDQADTQNLANQLRKLSLQASKPEVKKQLDSLAFETGKMFYTMSDMNFNMITPEQYIKSTVIDMKDQIASAARNEQQQPILGTEGVILGLAVIAYCGYNAIRNGYKAIFKPYK
jgi:hypothetical protein